MSAAATNERIEDYINQWRRHHAARTRPLAADADRRDPGQLEAALRQHLGPLLQAGLEADEAFLLALRRFDAKGPDTLAFAQRFWVPARTWPAPTRGDSAWPGRAGLAAFGFALLAALAVKLPALFGWHWGEAEDFYARNLSLFVLPPLAGYLLVTRASTRATRGVLAVMFLAAALAANAFAATFAQPLDLLTALHLPIALWLAIGIAHAGGRWNQVAARMDFVRFSGALFIGYVLIALGGAVLCGLTALLFQAIGTDIEPVFEQWILPCGALGAVVVAAWLAEARREVLESIAPLLTRLFTPLFVLALLAFLGTLVWRGEGVGFQRDQIIAFDLLLVVVLGLVLYAIAARDRLRPAAAFDWLQLALVACALLVDAAALYSITARITEFGFTPNRVAALGENLILLGNLAGSAVLYLRFLRGRAPFASLERWQTGFLPVYAVWAALVVAVFPWLLA